jgi:hypothetical protein
MAPAVFCMVRDQKIRLSAVHIAKVIAIPRQAGMKNQILILYSSRVYRVLLCQDSSDAGEPLPLGYRQKKNGSVY